MSFITMITLKSPLTTIELPVTLAKPDDQYILKGVDGLGPPQIDVSLADGLYQGGIYQGSFPQDREIVVLLKLNPRYRAGFLSAAGLRARLYSTMAGQYPTDIDIYTDSDDSESRYLPNHVVTQGYVKNVEITPFAKDSEVQITLICPKSWLEDAEDTVSVPPFENPLTYNATAPTGFLVEFVAKAAVSDLILDVVGNGITAESMLLTYPVAVDDVLYFDTRPGTRSVKLVKPLVSPTPIDITGFVTLASTRWPSLRPGSNQFSVYSAASGLSVLVESRSLTYLKQYWGV